MQKQTVLVTNSVIDDLEKMDQGIARSITDDMLQRGYDEQGVWHEGWRGPWKPNPLKPIDLNRHKRTESIILGCMIAGLLALICLVVHFGPQLDDLLSRWIG
jgi:hypothetical protein